MASIQESLYAALTADPALTALVGDRIYPGQVPDDETPPPWLYYAVPESTPFDELGDDVTARHQVEFHALGDTYATAKAIIDALFVALDTYVGGQISRAFWEGTSEEVTEDGYHHVARFTMWAASVAIVGAQGPRARITTGVGTITLYADGHTLTLDADGLQIDGEPVGFDPSYLTTGRVVYYDGAGLASAGDVSYSPTGTRLTVTGGPISCPEAGASERFGAGSSTGSAVQATALGANSTVTGNGGTAAGYGATSGAYGVAIGNGTTAPAFTPVVGYNQTVTTGGPSYGSDNVINNRSMAFGQQFTSTGFDQYLIGRGDTFAVPAEHHGTYIGSSYDRPSGHTLTLFGGSSAVGRPMARWAAEWVDATDATRQTRVRHLVYDATGVREGLRIESDGTHALIGVLGAAAVPRYVPAAVTTGHTSGGGTAVTEDSTFTGDYGGSSAYTIADVVRALKRFGFLQL